MATYTGTAGDDVQTGTADGDTFDYSQGGNDTLDGSLGNDVFRLGGAFTELDSINGGKGSDTLVLDGDYNLGQVTTTDTSFTDIETLRFKPGNSYTLIIQDANVSAGDRLTVDAQSLGGADFTYFDAHNETDASFTYLGGAGNDLVLLGAGNDIVEGGGGDDSVGLGTHFAGDHIDGGHGNDSVSAIFTTSVSLLFGPSTLENIETLYLLTSSGAGAVTFDVTIEDELIASGRSLFLQFAEAAGSTLTVHFDGHDETDGAITVNGASGDDTIYGGAQGDTIYMGGGGNDTIAGNGGDDLIVATVGFSTGVNFTAADRITGGTGYDTLYFAGDYSVTTVFAPDTMHGIEEFRLADDTDYSFQLDEANLDSGHTLKVDGSGLGAGDTLHFGASETDGFFDLRGGGGDDFLLAGDRADVIDGGGGNDLIVGLKGADRVIGGNGKDVIDVGAVNQSTGARYDTVVGFDFDHRDTFMLSKPVNGIDAALSGGTLRSDHFDADLGAALAGELGRRHAILFTPDSGDLAGTVFLIVDYNGTAGYQASHDYVFALEAPVHLGALDTSDFTSGS